MAIRLQQLARQQVAVYRPMVEEIILNKITDDNTIQRTLDKMLDFAFEEKMLLLYKKLCRYYWDINPQATANYINYYREMWDEDSQNQIAKNEKEAER